MKNHLAVILVLAITLFAFNFLIAQEQTIVGRWKTIDDETGVEKSIVSIYEKDGKYFGKIDTLFRTPDEDPDPVCDKCPEDDPRYNKRVVGMVILEDMVQDDDEWKDGKILDPKKGKVYNCKMWLEDGNLKVRGYIFFLYRTQIWYRVE